VRYWSNEKAEIVWFCPRFSDYISVDVFLIYQNIFVHVLVPQSYILCVCAVGCLFMPYTQKGTEPRSPAAKTADEDPHSVRHRFSHQVLLSVSGLRTQWLTIRRPFKRSHSLRSPHQNPCIRLPWPPHVLRASPITTHTTGTTAVHSHTASLNLTTR